MGDSTAAVASGRLKAAVAQAHVAVDPTRHCRLYYRSLSQMLNMAAIYEEEGDLLKAYLLHMRLTVLVLEGLPRHPEYEAGGRDATAAKRSVMTSLRAAERLKPLVLERLQRVVAQENEQEEARLRALAEEQRVADEQALALKQAEEARAAKAAARALAAQAALVEPGAHPAAAPRPPVPVLGALTPAPAAAAAGLSVPAPPQAASAPPAYPSLYPAVSEASPDALPPAYEAVAMPSAPPLASGMQEHVPSASRPQGLVEGLRDVIVPRAMITDFLAVARPNTVKNIETCGILAGTMRNNTFVVTCTIIPKQTGTSDSCSTVNEEELFEFQDARSLLTLGWIHTHPTQTAFLSSVDLHTSLSYQLLLPEALAIVCAPKYNDEVCFRLTEHGLEYISACKLTGFHPHQENPPLFERSGHVVMRTDQPYQIHDLR